MIWQGYSKLNNRVSLFLENVKGLVNHEQGKTIRRILDLLQSCCYKVYFQVLNSIDFGLPHSRERVYFVGIRKDINVPDFDFQYTSKISDLRNFLEPKDSNLFGKGTANYQTFLKYLGNKYNKNVYDLNLILKQDFLVLDTRQSDLRIYRNKIPTLRRDRQGLLYVYKNNYIA